MNKIESKLTTHEMSALTGMIHETVLERACEALISANINPNEYWDTLDYPPYKVLFLPKALVEIVLNDGWYGDRAKHEVMDVFAVWERNGSLD
jgi:hypothetical protein